MIDFYALQISVTYNKETGKHTSTSHRHEIRECREEDFIRDVFEQNYWKFASDRNWLIYCIDNPEKSLSLTGLFENSMRN